MGLAVLARMHPIPLQLSVSLTPYPGSPPVSVNVQGQAVLASAADPAHVAAAIREAVEGVVSAKLHANQVAMPTLAMSLPYYTQEIAAAAGARLGAQVTSLELTAHVPPEAMAPAAAQVMTAGEIAANVGGNFADNAISAAMPGPRIQANIGGMRLNVGPGAASLDEQVEKQAENEMKDRLLHYAIVGGVLVLITGICVVSLVVKLLF